MGKYDPLRAHLRNHGGQSISMTFRQIETVIGADLPPSATIHREWWGNTPVTSQAIAWHEAGYRVDSVNQSGEFVRFTKQR